MLSHFECVNKVNYIIKNKNNNNRLMRADVYSIIYNKEVDIIKQIHVYSSSLVYKFIEKYFKTYIESTFLSIIMFTNST